jgi:hypothetical protein
MTVGIGVSGYLARWGFPFAKAGEGNRSEGVRQMTHQSVGGEGVEGAPSSSPPGQSKARTTRQCTPTKVVEHEALLADHRVV